MKLSLFLAIALLGGSLHAQSLVDPNLGGNTATDTWVDLPSHGSVAVANNPWSTPFASNGPGSTGTTYLNKTSGSGYVTADHSIYTFFGAGNFSIYSNEALEGLQTIVFQISYGYALPAASGPVLTIGDGINTYELGLALNGGTLNFSGSTFVDVLGADADVDIWTYQWDLRDFENITSFAISFGFVADSHTQIYEMRVDQGDQFQAVPEPSTWALIGIALVAGGARLRRRRLAA